MAWEVTGSGSSRSLDGLPWARKALYECELEIQGDVPANDRAALLNELREYFALRCSAAGVILIKSKSAVRSPRACTLAYSEPGRGGAYGAADFEFIDTTDGLLQIRMSAHERVRER